MKNLKGSRINDILLAINNQVEINLKSKEERDFYSACVNEAEAYEKSHGSWPVFEMVEYEDEDPRMDIYR